MKPRVTRITQTTLIDKLGNPVAAFNVQWVLGDQGPFSIQILATEFTAQEVMRRLDLAATHFNALLTPP